MPSSIRGITGYYKTYYLRSSYEYAFARYLDEKKIEWTYEEKHFQLNEGVKYKPDFFIKKNGKTEKVVEIKSNSKIEMEKALQKKEQFEKIYQIPCEIITYNELKKMYKEISENLDEITTQWKDKNRDNKNYGMIGENNPHYGMKHGEGTLKKIGISTQERWNRNDESTKRMIEGLRKSGQAQKGKIKSPRFKVDCIGCGSSFERTKRSKRLYCTQTCAGKQNIILATERWEQNKRKRDEKVRDIILEWCRKNKESVLNCKFNKITPTFKELTDILEKEYDIKDYRTITLSYFGEQKSRKEFLQSLKRELS